MISRFIDGELRPFESERVQAHLDICPSCRRTEETNRFFCEHFKKTVATERRRVNFDTFEYRLFSKIKNRPVSWKVRVFEFITLKRFYIPSTALAAALILFFVLFSPTGLPPGPSAIVTSFSGEMSSVMIFETPETHQTILWFNEKLSTNEEQHAI